MRLPPPIHRRIEAMLLGLMQPADWHEDFSQPPGEPAFTAPGSVTWQVFDNPLALFVGGVAGVILELAEPRVCAGVWGHTYFRDRPLQRMQRTAMAAMLSVYGARSRSEAMIDGVRRRHAKVGGVTSAGEAYRADDPELLNWVHVTASFGFVEAYDRYVRRLPESAHDRYYEEGRPIAERFGATAVPDSRRAVRALLAGMQPRLQASVALDEFIAIVRDRPLLPAALRWLQRPAVEAAIALLPVDIRGCLGLDRPPSMAALGLIRIAGRIADRFELHDGPAAASRRRLGLS